MFWPALLFNRRNKRLSGHDPEVVKMMALTPEELPWTLNKSKSKECLSESVCVCVCECLFYFPSTADAACCLAPAGSTQPAWIRQVSPPSLSWSRHWLIAGLTKACPDHLHCTVLSWICRSALYPVLSGAAARSSFLPPSSGKLALRIIPK